jgi:hypothetical protein
MPVTSFSKPDAANVNFWPRPCPAQPRQARALTLHASLIICTHSNLLVECSRLHKKQISTAESCNIYVNGVIAKSLGKGKFVPVLNQSSTTPRRCMGDWKYSSTILGLEIRWRWVVSFTLWPLYSDENGWAQKSVWMLWRKERSLASAMNQTQLPASPLLYEVSYPSSLDHQKSEHYIHVTIYKQLRKRTWS